MKLSQLCEDLPYLIDTQGNLETEIEAVVSSSKEKSRNGIFFCIVGARFDAHAYAAEAVANGCAALMVERYLNGKVDRPELENRIMNAVLTP